MRASPGLVAIYRWRIADEHLPAFRRKWRETTLALRSRGGSGSLLGRADDGTYHAIALWPDAATRDRAFADLPDGEPWPLVERLDPILIEPLDDLWES